MQGCRWHSPAGGYKESAPTISNIIYIILQSHKATICIHQTEESACFTDVDKLYESVAANGPVCVGLDTEISYLPTTDTARTAGENVVAFNRALIDATKGVAGCYKVQIAYYESLGLDGMRAYAETLKMARATGLPVIADIKRGDIAKTAEMYAKAHFTGDFEADIITLAPYMGLDSISPYLPYCAEQGKGVFVLCRTSNPGAKDFVRTKSWTIAATSMTSSATA